MALNWAREIKEIYDDANADGETTTTKIQLEDRQKKAIADVLSHLNLIADQMERSATSFETEEMYQKVQTIIFQKSKENGIQPKDFFKLFYRILINAEKGPRLGNYIVDLGINNSINKIEKKIM